jgi:hypothetical protein
MLLDCLMLILFRLNFWGVCELFLLFFRFFWSLINEREREGVRDDEEARRDIKRERRESTLFKIIINYWLATVLPNGLGSFKACCRLFL